jgi:pimeloyl-ACP methyl ester carboxylesterase
MVPGGVDLFVAWADGPADRTLLVIHGGPDWDHSYLREPLDALAGTHRLLLPDIRGCGRSVRGLPAAEYNPDAVVGDLLAVLDAFDVAQADVLGFSYGGLLAQRFAVTAPDRLRSLIVASSSVLPVAADVFAGWRERDERRAAELAVWCNSSLSGSELTRAAAVAGARANVWRPEALPGYLRRLDEVQFSGEWMRSRRAGTLRSPRINNPARRLSALDVPMLLLHGRQDMIFPAELATQAAVLIPAARTVVLDDAGHMAHIDLPRQWLAAIADFIS